MQNLYSKCGHIDPNNISYSFSIYVHGPNPKNEMMVGVSEGWGCQLLFWFLIKPQKVLAWGGAKVCQPWQSLTV